MAHAVFVVPLHAPLYDPQVIGRLRLANRVAVAPMTRISATEDGQATPQMNAYYGTFAEGKFGLVITEGLYTDKAFSQGYHYQPGLTDAAQGASWRSVVERVHAAGGRIFAQLMHAGAISQGNRYRDRTVAPSAIMPKGEQMSFYRGSGPYAMPAEISHAEIQQAIEGFAAAASCAKHAGFDGVEIHAANGYLLDQFLTEGTNQRKDGYGGAVASRLRLLIEVIDAVRSAVGDEFVVGVRVSQAKVNDFFHKWSGGEAEAAEVFRLLGAQRIEYLHTTEFEAWRPAAGDIGPSFAWLAKRHSRLPVIANGSLHDPDRAMGMVRAGDADIVSLGRGALTHSDWPKRVWSGIALSEFDRGLLSPIADLANAAKSGLSVLKADMA